MALAYVACGRLGGFCEMNLKPWDYAAGAPLVEEAGGRVTSAREAPASLLAPCDIVAGSRGVHAQLARLMDERRYGF